jgi:hypothetical protein
MAARRWSSAAVSWSLSADGGSTRIDLRAEVGRMGTLDRVLWALGGRRWMRRRFDSVLRGLAARFALPAAKP